MGREWRDRMATSMVYQILMLGMVQAKPFPYHWSLQ